MKKEDLFEALEGIDDKYLTKTDNFRPREKSKAWIGILLIAAGLAIIFVKIGMLPNINKTDKDDKVVIAESTTSHQESTTKEYTTYPQATQPYTPPLQTEDGTEKWNNLTVTVELYTLLKETKDASTKITLLVEPTIDKKIKVDGTSIADYEQAYLQDKGDSAKKKAYENALGVYINNVSLNITRNISDLGTVYLSYEKKAFIVEITMEQLASLATGAGYGAFDGWVFDLPKDEDKLSAVEVPQVVDEIKADDNCKLKTVPEDVLDALSLVTVVKKDALSDIMFVRYATTYASDHLSTFFGEGVKTVDDFSLEYKLALAIKETPYIEKYNENTMTNERLYAEEDVKKVYEKRFGVGTYSRMDYVFGHAFFEEFSGYSSIPGGGGGPRVEGLARFEGYQVSGNTLKISLSACAVGYMSTYYNTCPERALFSSEFHARYYSEENQKKSIDLSLKGSDIPLIFETDNINEIFNGKPESYNKMTVTFEKDAAGNYIFKKIEVR